MSSSFLLICVLSLVVQKCQGVLKVPVRDYVFMSALTPFNKDETINYPAIADLAQLYKAQGAKVIYVSGYYGGGPSISLRERKLLAKEWNRQANCLDLDLIIEIGAMPYVDTLEMARYCSKLNVTAISTFAEIVYQATTLSEALEDLQRICDATRSKIPLLYHELVVVNQNINTVEIFKGAVEKCVSCFVGVITSINSFLDIKACVPSIAGYLLVNYGVDAIAASMKVGMNATEVVNLFPEITLKIQRAIYECKLDLSEDEQQNMNRRFYGISNPNNVGVTDQTSRTYFEQEKAAFKLLTGIDVGYRYPLKEPNSTVICQIQSNLENLGVRLSSKRSDCNN